MPPLTRRQFLEDSVLATAATADWRRSFVSGFIAIVLAVCTTGCWPHEPAAEVPLAPGPKGVRGAEDGASALDRTTVELRSATVVRDSEPVPLPAPQSPVAPADALQYFVVHPECRIELVAAEPDVISPIQVAFDPDGRMWVIEYSDYPNGPEEGDPGRSRIRVLTDDNGDGRFENAQIFADKL